MTTTADALSAIVRDEAGAIVAGLVRTIGDFGVAEDALQDAIVEALQAWPVSGVPPQPGAWLRLTARRKAIDRLRRQSRLRDKLQVLGKLTENDSITATSVIDDRLALIFMCCHPSLSPQVALMLRSVLGLSTTQLSRAFLTTEATMTKRITRAKRKIVEAGVPFRVPAGEELRCRRNDVLAAVYLMFNEGYLSSGPDGPERAELAGDAEWLAGLLLQLLPDDPEVLGLLALIRLNQARRRARFDAAEHLVLLRDQDRSVWDRVAIDDALALLNRALRQAKPGYFQGLAAITACHAKARRWEDTNWDQIVALYDILVTLTDSPIIKLNRAIALEHTQGASAALAALEPLAQSLASYHLFHATRAQLLRDVGRPAEAVMEDSTARTMTQNPAERYLLEQRADGAL